MADYIQELENVLEDNKAILQRLKGTEFSSWDNQDLFYRAKTILEMGYPAYCIVEIDGVGYNAELINYCQWTTSSVNVKLNNGKELTVPMDSIKMVKTF